MEFEPPSLRMSLCHPRPVSVKSRYIKFKRPTPTRGSQVSNLFKAVPLNLKTNKSLFFIMYQGPKTTGPLGASLGLQLICQYGTDYTGLKLNQYPNFCTGILDILFKCFKLSNLHTLGIHKCKQTKKFSFIKCHLDIQADFPKGN